MEQFRSKHKQTQSEWEAEMSKKVLEFVRSELYMDLRFLDIALGTLVYRADENIRSFATDGTYLYFSTEQVLRVFQSNPKYLDRAYLHSVLHCIFFHLWIGGKRDREKWNLACDIAVEYTIDQMDKPSTRRILSWQRQTVYEELKQLKSGISAAVIYRYLSGRKPAELIALQKEFYTDDHRYWPKEEQKNAVNEDARKQWDKIARQTRMEKESRGDETEDGEDILAAQLKAEKSRQSYADFLRKFSVLREELPGDAEKHIFVFERASRFELLSGNSLCFCWSSPVSETELDRYGLVERRCMDGARTYNDLLIHKKEYSPSEVDRIFLRILHKTKENLSI